MPSSDWEIEKLLEEHKEYYFKMEDVTKFEDNKRQGKTAKQKEDGLITMFKTAGPQIEKLYSIFLEKYSSWPAEDKEKMRAYVIKRYKSDRDSYNIIKIEWLSEKSFYNFNRERHAIDDFIGRLLLKTAKDWGLERNNVQKIYNEFKEFKKSIG
jgi:hypothetical protein